MKMKELLKFDEHVYGSTHDVSINYFLHNQKEYQLVLTEDDIDIPAEVSIYKYLTNIPIIVVEMVEHTDKIRFTITKGSNEIKNILKWINGEIVVNIPGLNPNFSELSDEDKESFLNHSSIGLHRVSIKDEEKIGQLKEIIKTFC